MFPSNESDNYWPEQYATAIRNSYAGNDTSSQFFFMSLFVLAAVGLSFLLSVRYAISTLGRSLLTIAVSLQWAVLAAGFWDACEYTYRTDAEGWVAIPLNAAAIMRALYVAVAVLVAQAAAGARFSTGQSLATTFFGIGFITANLKIAEMNHIVDAGGSMWIHVFASVFGIVAASVQAQLNSGSGSEVTVASTRGRLAGAWGMLGSLVLFTIFPIFNSSQFPYFIDENTEPDAAYSAWGRASVNTIMAMTGSVAAAFLVTRAVKGKFTYSSIQTAAISGGISIAASAPYLANPWGAILNGGVAAAAVVLSLRYVQPHLAKFGLVDVSGVFSSHFLPGMVGSISAAIAAARVESGLGFNEGSIAILLHDGRSALTQGGYIMAFGCVSLAFGALAGVLVGALVALPIFSPRTAATVDDAEEWDGLDDELPPVNAQHFVINVPEDATASTFKVELTVPPKVTETVSASASAE
jgi:ammonium transporter Rh